MFNDSVVTTVLDVDENVSSSVLLVAGFAFFVLGILSIVGNIAVGYTFCRHDTLRESAANTYIVNLATMNAILGCLSVRIAIEVLTKKSTFHLSEKYCNVEGFLVSSIHINVMMTIAIIMVERYIVVCRWKNSGKLSFFHDKPMPCLLLSLLYSFIWSSPPLTEYVPQYNKLNGINSCMFDFITKTSPNLTYILGMMIFVCFIPFGCISFTMIPICKALRKSLRNLNTKNTRVYSFRRTRASKMTVNFDSSINSGITSTGVVFQEVPETTRGYTKTSTSETTKEVLTTEQRETLRKLKEDKRELRRQRRRTDRIIMQALATMTLCYLLSWLPISVVILCQMIGNVKVSQTAIVFTLLLAKTSCIHSTFIYIARRHKVQTAKLLSCTNCSKLPK